MNQLHCKRVSLQANKYGNLLRDTKEPYMGGPCCE
jgi:hypothetical protein